MALLVKGFGGNLKALNGTYSESNTENYARSVFEKTGPSPNAQKSCVYYWDDRDGEDRSGWFIAPEVGARVSWMQNHTSELLPPKGGWRPTLRGVVDPEVTFTFTYRHQNLSSAHPVQGVEDPKSIITCQCKRLSGRKEAAHSRSIALWSAFQNITHTLRMPGVKDCEIQEIRKIKQVACPNAHHGHCECMLLVVAEELKKCANASYRAGRFPHALVEYMRIADILFQNVSFLLAVAAEDASYFHAAIRSNVSALLFESGQYKESADVAKTVTSMECSPSDRLSVLVAKNETRMKRAAEFDVGAGFVGGFVPYVPDLPRYRARRLNRHYELYTGQEGGFSALRDRNLNIIFDVANASKRNGNAFSVFFGGCGDARHFMITTMDAYFQISRAHDCGSTKKKNKKNKKKNSDTPANTPSSLSTAHIHFVLNDIHPTVFARLLLVAHFAEQLVASVGGRGANLCEALESNAQAKDIATLLQYLYLGPLIPPRLYNALLVPAVRQLLSIEVFDKFQLAGDTLAATRQVWTRWLESPHLPRPDDIMSCWSICPQDITHLSTVAMDAALANPEVRERLKEREAQMVSILWEQLERMSADDFYAMRRTMLTFDQVTAGGHTLMEKKKIVFELLKEKALGNERPRLLEGGGNVDLMYNICRIGLGNTEYEHFVACQRMILLPPGIAAKVLGASTTRSTKHRGGAKKDHDEYYQSVALHISMQEPAAKVAWLQQCVEKCEAEWGPMREWRCNLLTVDAAYAEESDHHLELSYDPFQVVADLYDTELNHVEERQCACYSVIPIPPHPKELLDYTALFFYHFGCALRCFHTSGAPPDSASPLTMHAVLHCGDMFDCLDACEEHSGTTTLENRSFHKLYLSNVPDYAGMLSVFLSALPRARPHGLVQSNILLNTGLWHKYADYVYSGSFVDMTQGEHALLFGAELLAGGVWEDTIWARALPNTLSPHAIERHLVKDKAQEYLVRLLLYLVLPARSAEPPNDACRVTMPMNATYLFRTIDHLVRYQAMPPHWATEVLEAVLTNTLVSRVAPPAAHPPTPCARETVKAQKIDLYFCTAEMRALTTRFGGVARGESRAAYIPCVAKRLCPPMPSAIARYRLCGLNVMCASLCGFPRRDIIGFAIVHMRRLNIKIHDDYSWSDEEEKLLKKNAEECESGSDYDLFSLRMEPDLPMMRVIDVRDALNADRVMIPEHFIPNTSVHFGNHMSRFVVRHLFTTVVFDSQLANVDWWMAQEDFEKCASERRTYGVLFDYKSWKTLSVPRPLTEAITVRVRV